MDVPQNPAGDFQPEMNFDARRQMEFIEQIESAPDAVRKAVQNLTEVQLNTRYRNWTIRQIVRHLADSHVNSYIRFKWALTEDLPTIKPYDEGKWAALDDSRLGGIGASLALLEGLHRCWGQLLRSMSAELFSRGFVHPETNSTIRLSEALCYYAWHSRHHTAQIIWLRQHYKW